VARFEHIDRGFHRHHCRGRTLSTQRSSGVPTGPSQHCPQPSRLSRKEPSCGRLPQPGELRPICLFAHHFHPKASTGAIRQRSGRCRRLGGIDSLRCETQRYDAFPRPFRDTSRCHSLGTCDRTVTTFSSRWSTRVVRESKGVCDRSSGVLALRAILRRYPPHVGCEQHFAGAW
jgi:hypothetical protein